jgi:hypothetical protein
MFYGCAGYARRGTTVCGNNLVAPMEHADAAVLSALEETLLHPSVLEAALHRAVSRLSQAPGTRISLDGERARLEQELAHLTEAIAAGGDVPTLVAAVHEREARRRALLAESQERAPTAAVDPKAVLADLRHRLEDWRAILHDHPPRARQIVKQLIVGRLEMRPNRDEGYYTFKGTGTVLPLVVGTVPQSVASLTGSGASCIYKFSGIAA